MAEKDKVAERRDQGDRREGQQGQGRRGDKKRSSGLLYVLRAVGLVVVLVAVIVYTVPTRAPSTRPAAHSGKSCGSVHLAWRG